MLSKKQLTLELLCFATTWATWFQSTYIKQQKDNEEKDESMHHIFKINSRTSNDGSKKNGFNHVGQNLTIKKKKQ